MLRLLIMSMLLTSFLTAEVVIELDGNSQSVTNQLGDGERLMEGVCLVAGSDDLLGKVFHDTVMGRLMPFAVSYALKGELGICAKIDPIPPEQWQADHCIVVILEEGTATAIKAKDPYTYDVVSDPRSAAFMDRDMNGVEGFIKVVKSGIADAEKAGKIPRVALVVRSATRFSEMVAMWQLLRLAGCSHGAMMLNDRVAGLKIDVVQAPGGQPVPQQLKADASYVLVRLEEDGTIGAGQNIILPNDLAVMDYVRSKKENLAAQGREVRLYLRGQKNAISHHGKKVVDLAANVGVDKVVYSYILEPPVDGEK